jgi:hypothetical protein
VTDKCGIKRAVPGVVRNGGKREECVSMAIVTVTENFVQYGDRIFPRIRPAKSDVSDPERTADSIKRGKEFIKRLFGSKNPNAELRKISAEQQQRRKDALANVNEKLKTETDAWGRFELEAKRQSLESEIEFYERKNAPEYVAAQEKARRRFNKRVVATFNRWRELAVRTGLICTRSRACEVHAKAHTHKVADSPGDDDDGDPDSPGPGSRAYPLLSVISHSKRNKPEYFNRRLSRRSWRMTERGRAA